MKKYLMGGIAAVAICAAFTSCSKSNDIYDAGAVEQQKQEAINKNIETAKANYAAAFEKAFGKVGSNVDWGFGSKATTRSVDVNGNLWETQPSVTKAEAEAVYAWVNRAKADIPKESYSEVSPVDLKNFFVSQVWGGKNDDANCLYLNGDQMIEASKGRTYQNNEKVHGASKMNHLQISKSDTRLGDGQAELDSNWDHANNFNAGNNYDWDGNTMFVDWGTKNFAYHSTEDSKYHDKWIIVDGSYITDAEGVNHAGQYYVCFDFIATNPNIKTKFRAWVPGNNSGEVLERGPFEVSGAYTMESAIAAGVKITVEGKEYTISDATITQNGVERPMFAIEGYVGGNMFVPANEYYTDWIVRLVEAKPKTTPLYRVIAEDLNATEASDFDFNDVVFDVVKAENGKTTLRLIACGGIYKLTVAGVEVHEKFGQQATDDKYPMINTGAKANINGLAPVEFDINGTFDTPEKINSIEIRVWKPGTGDDGIALTAEKGKAACKILVDNSFEVVPERQGIGNEYGLFQSYVRGEWDSIVDGKWWIKK